MRSISTFTAFIVCSGIGACTDIEGGSVRTAPESESPDRRPSDPMDRRTVPPPVIIDPMDGGGPPPLPVTDAGCPAGSRPSGVLAFEDLRSFFAQAKRDWWLVFVAYVARVDDLPDGSYSPVPGVHFDYDVRSTHLELVANIAEHIAVPLAFDRQFTSARCYPARYDEEYTGNRNYAPICIDTDRFDVGTSMLLLGPRLDLLQGQYLLGPDGLAVVDRCTTRTIDVDGLRDLYLREPPSR